MPTYQLQIKQIVDYSRCRIYRQFIRFLMEERSIRISGVSLHKRNVSSRLTFSTENHNCHLCVGILPLLILCLFCLFVFLP